MLVINVRNVLYLLTVSYKISRRLALLAPAPLPVRLSGVALTFLGVFLGLWQAVLYTAVDAAFDMVVAKGIVLGLSQCSLVAVVAWQLWIVGLLSFRAGSKAWTLAKMAFREARLLVLAPQALLVNNQALVGAEGSSGVSWVLRARVGVGGQGALGPGAAVLAASPSLQQRLCCSGWASQAATRASCCPAQLPGLSARANAWAAHCLAAP